MDADGDGFGARLRACREAAGLSQQELADRAELSIRAVGNMERSRTQWPYRASLSRLADALNLSEAARAELLATVPRRQLARPTADSTGADRRPQSAGSGIPRELPAGVRHFTGRAAELAMLDQLLADVGVGAPGMVVISAIGGTAGVGKTALAIQWAHQVAEHFPDGQLYVNLRGYDPGDPVSPGDALAGFLRALGVPGQDIPPEPEQRAARYRSLLSGRRMLVVLDNAGDAGQIRPLLPGTPGCLVVVTSRDTLAGLVARDGARRIELDALPLTDAIALLRELIGQRADAEPGAAARLAALSCRLPLALRVAAESAAARPNQPLIALVDELEVQDGLEKFNAGGDQATAVRAVFSWSYRHLSADAAHVFRRLALNPGPDVGLDGVAALTGMSRRHAREALAELSRAHLVWPTDDGRYSTHDLLRAYSTELAAFDEPEAARREAITRMLDYYLDTAADAVRILFHEDGPSSPATTHADPSVAEFPDEHKARAWLDAERANLAAAAAYAADHDWSRHAVGLSAGLSRYLSVSGFMREALLIHDAAARAAIAGGDQLAEVAAVIGLGTVYLQLCQYPQAAQHCQHALAVSREISYQLGEMRALINLGQIYLLTGDYGNASECSQQALDLSRSTGSRTREARALWNLGLVARYQGHYQQGAAFLRQAVETSRRDADLAGLAFALGNLGEVEVLQGRFSEARRHLKEARTISRQIGHVMGEANATYFLGLADLRQGRLDEASRQVSSALEVAREAGASAAEAYALCSLGEIDLRQGDIPGAVGRFEQALALFRHAGERSGQAEAHNCLGEAALAGGAPSLASAHHRQALDLARRLGNLEQQARAHNGLGNASAADQTAAKARQHWREALDVYSEMDSPEADRLRVKLAVDRPVQMP